MSATVTSSPERRRGEAMAELLAGCWRPTPPALSLSAEAILDLAPLALTCGVGGLAWWRLRAARQYAPAVTRPFREEYRLLAADALQREDDLRAAVASLRAAGVEPILIKGWSVARRYPDPGLRPLGDIDLCVRPDQLDNAVVALKGADLPLVTVDLHAGVPDLADRPWDVVFRRSGLAPLGDVEVRVLGDEDLLRLLCLHFVRHLGCRPLWLVDVAMFLESLPGDFDWDCCLSGKPHWSRWVLCVTELARQLLGARSEAPAAALPPWLAPSVLWHWGAGLDPGPLSRVLRRPAALPDVLRYRWLNPVRAAWRLGLPPLRSQLLIQLASLLSRPVQASVRLARGIRRCRPSPELPFDIHRQRTF